MEKLSSSQSSTNDTELIHQDSYATLAKFYTKNVNNKFCSDVCDFCGKKCDCKWMNTLRFNNLKGKYTKITEPYNDENKQEMFKSENITLDVCV